MASRLKRIDLSSKPREVVTALSKLLAGHAPHCLHVLGSILNTCHRSGSGVDHSKIYLWSTTPFDTHDLQPPSLFSIVTFSPVSYQFRFFCSAESSHIDPTEEETAHVTHVFRSLLRMASVESPTYDSILVMRPKDIGLGRSGPKVRVESDPPMISIGAVSRKWHGCLQQLAVCQNPSIRFVLPPRTFNGETLSSSLNSSADWIVGQIRESDISTIRAGSSAPRSAEYIMSRAPYSVCIRTRGGDGEDGGKPIAWALMHADGSIGALYVDQAYRRHGLAKLVINALVKQLDLRRADKTFPSADEDLGGGALGWNWVETDVWNQGARGLFSGFEGWWDEGKCHWTYMLIPERAEVPER